MLGPGAQLFRRSLSGEWLGHAIGRPLVFLHIPKAAGTTVATMLEQWFADEQIMPWNLINDKSPSHPAYALAARKYQLFGLGSHFDGDAIAAFSDLIHRAGRRPFVAAMLREPRSRLISQYHHWRRTDDASLAGVDPSIARAYLLARERSIGDFLHSNDPQVVSHFWNYQARLIAGLGPSAEQCSDVIAATAYHLLSDYDLVGTTFAVEQFLAALAEAYGIETAPFGPAMNQGGAPADHRYVAATEAVIAHFIEADQALWDAVCRAGRRTVVPPGGQSHFRMSWPFVSTLVSGGKTFFSMRDALIGSGWHGREGEQHDVRWSGPALTSTLRLPVPIGSRLRVTLALAAVVDAAVLDGLELSLDGSSPIGPVRLDPTVTDQLLTAEFAVDDRPADARLLAIAVPFVKTDGDPDAAGADHRPRGVALRSIAVAAIPPAPAETLAQLFWEGEPWGRQRLDGELCAAAVCSGPPTDPVLALTRCLLNLVQPERLFLPVPAGRFAGLSAGEAETGNAQSLVICTTPAELTNYGDSVARLAASSSRATLILAEAADLRLELLRHHPLLCSHASYLGSNQELLVVSLSGLRERGGVGLVNALLWLLERAAATAPGQLLRQRSALDQLHADLQLRLLLSALQAVAAGADAGPALLRTLLPEEASPPALDVLLAGAGSLRPSADLEAALQEIARRGLSEELRPTLLIRACELCWQELTTRLRDQAGERGVSTQAVLLPV